MRVIRQFKDEIMNPSMPCYASHMQTISVVAQQHVPPRARSGFLCPTLHFTTFSSKSAVPPVLQVLHDNTTMYDAEHADARNGSACTTYKTACMCFVPRAPFPLGPPEAKAKQKQCIGNNRLHHLIPPSNQTAAIGLPSPHPWRNISSYPSDGQPCV